MNFGIYSYAATILIFTGGAGLLYSVMYIFKRRSAHLPRKYWPIILLVIFASVVCTSPGEGFALLWRTWQYNPERTFYTTLLGAEVETYLFAALVSFVVGLATLVYARREDRKRFSNITPRI